MSKTANPEPLRIMCKHTPGPKGYVQWCEWAEKKNKTHRQIKCKHCGLWSVWVPRSHGARSADRGERGE